MIIVEKKIGNLSDVAPGNRVVDRVSLEWFETNKRILHKRSSSGKEVVMRFLKESPQLTQDDIVHADDDCLVVIDIIACDAIIVRPATMFEMARLCYEIGNKHLPLFLEDHEVLVPYEAPLLRSLSVAGFNPLQERRKLLFPLRTTVAPHSHSGGESLFSKILQLTDKAKISGS